MNYLSVATLAFSFCAASSALAQTKADQERVRTLPMAFCSAFNRHDAHQLAEILAEDADFVTVGALLLHGRSDFEQYHRRLLTGRFNRARIELLQASVHFLSQTVAVVHWSWTVTGDRNPDGTPRQRRYGLMTMVAEKRAGAWLVAASQNDNSIPGSAAELDGITSPMPIPDQVGRQPPNR